MPKLSHPPLIVETHPVEYTGFPFITLLQFKNEHFLCVTDNADENTINAYVLDLCGANGVSEELIVNVAQLWYDNGSHRYPLSVEFSKRGLSGQAGLIYKTFPVEFVTRVIGPLYSYPMIVQTKTKRRRKKPINPNIQIHKQVVVVF